MASTSDRRLAVDPDTVSETTLRVRYKDTDAMGICYYGNYLTFFEVGRVEYLRQHGLPMSEVDKRLHLPVVEAHVRYHRPARLDDLLVVRAWIGAKRRASFEFRYEIRHAETQELIASGHTLHACLEVGTGKMVGIPEWLNDRLPDREVETPG